jgi:hypothetical protein
MFNGYCFVPLIAIEENLFKDGAPKEAPTIRVEKIEGA